MGIHLFFLSIFLWCSTALTLDTRLDYSQIETPHFILIFEKGDEALARIYAQEAESSYNQIQPLFKKTPHKTIIVIDDTTDLANGSAITFPHPLIMAYPTLPLPTASNDDYGNWPQELVLHEYTHILNLYPSYGFWRPLRFIFGSIASPNMFLPRWYIEGLAVEIESRYTEHGRLRSPQYQELIRSQVIAGVWGQEDLSTLNDPQPSWPLGQRPYFYGALLWHEIVRQDSPLLITKLNDQYASRVPYFLNGPMEETLNKDLEKLLHETFLFHKKIAEIQIQQISQSHTPQGSRVNIKNSYYNHSPEINPDGKTLIFISKNISGDDSIYSVHRDKDDFNLKNPTKVVEKSNIHRATWTPDGKKIIFDATSTFNHYYNFYDLYSYDTETKKTIQLTHGLRAFDPSVSPSGQDVIFVKRHGGRQSLNRLNLESQKIDLIYEGKFSERLSSPMFLDSRAILFVKKDSNGQESLFKLQLRSKNLKKLLPQLTSVQFPRRTKEGFIFSSAHTGVRNLYLTDKNFKKLTPLTNSRTSVINGQLDSKSRHIIFSQLNQHGFQIEVAPRLENVRPPKITSPLKTDFAALTKLKKPILEVESQDYTPSAFMWPQYWYPLMTMVNDETILTAQTAGGDPVGQHSYSLFGEIDSRVNKPGISAQYNFNSKIGLWGLSGYKLHSYSTVLGTTSVLSGGSLSYSNFIFDDSNKWTGFINWGYLQTNSSSLSESHVFSGPTAGFTYKNLSKKNFSISETGNWFKAHVTTYLPNETKTHYSRANINTGLVTNKFLPEDHAFLIKTNLTTSPANRDISLGTISAEVPLLLTLQDNPNAFLMRGYPAGEFIGWSLAQVSTEYRLPLANVYKGYQTWPLFFKKMYASFFADALLIDGAYVNNSGSLVRDEKENTFTSLGMELNFDLTAGYILPVKLQIGYAVGANKIANGQQSLYFAIKL